MGSFIFLTFLLVIALVGGSALNKAGKDPDSDVPKGFGKGLMFVAALVYVFFAFITSIRSVDAGEQAVVTRFGQVQGNTLGSGLHLVAPFGIDSVKVFSVREEKIEDSAAAASKDLQQVDTAVAINLRLDPQRINDLYRTVGTDWVSRIVSPAVQDVVKATTAQFTAEELITRRPEVSELMNKTLAERLSGNHIIVQRVSITNFDFSADFDKSIEAKQIAQQSALKATQDLERIKVEAQQTIAQAQAQAESQRVQQQTLTPELLQKYAIDKWDGKLPTTNAAASLPFLNLK